MSVQKKIGDRGEKLAIDFLKKNGYQILETNWRYKRAEIDIIAMDGKVLVLVEVKTRSYDYFGPPDAHVDRKKEKMMTSAAHVYMEEIQHDWEVRFDIISILINQDTAPQIKHIEDAFFHGL